MAPSPKNAAAYATAPQSPPFQILDAPYPHPKDDEIVIKTAAVAINPVDWKLQASPLYPLPYPFILGSDTAGEIVDVGARVKNGMKTGMRVVGHAQGLALGQAERSSFQLYVALPAHMACPIPAHVPFSDAVVLPLGTSTAAAGLFQKNHLALPLPSLEPKPAGKTLLIWGGASSVGSCAIQLAKAAGVSVFATASLPNYEYCRGLGAENVFDYKSEGVVGQIVKALQGREFVGVYDAITVGQGTAACCEIVKKVLGRGMVISVIPRTESKAEGVVVENVLATTITDDEVGPAIYQGFLPKALEKGCFVAKPDALVAGHGLENIQTGVDLLKEGVSAKKVVVTI